MSKDPAVLLYTSDFLSGTMTMTDEQVGKYIRLLCLQHQKGFLTEKDMLYICKSYDEDVYGKFVIEDGKYYNVRMRDEGEKRRIYAESRRNNRTKKDMINISSTYVEHMENENENEDINTNKVLNNNNVTKEHTRNITLERWNSFAKENGLSAVIKLSEKRRVGILNRLLEPEFDLDKIFLEIKHSDFLRGSNGNWKVDFDFVFCSANNYLKILEGKYRNGNNVGTGRKSDATERATFRHTEQQIQDNLDFAESLRNRVAERR